MVGAKSLVQWFKAPLLSPFVSQRVVMFVAAINTADLAALMELIQAKKVTPVVDKSYPLSQVPEAIRYLEEGHPRGKIVITIA